MTALDAHSHLVQLHAERALAVSETGRDADEYLAELEDEITRWRATYIGTAVTEIATLRAELFGPQLG